MAMLDPTNFDHIAGTHAVSRPEMYAAYADRIDQFLNGLEAELRSGGTLTDATVMAFTAIRSGLDFLGEITEGCRSAYDRQAVTA